ncbi:MAG: TonB-dependent receptor [Puia sp.]|nr:TonB-dependent receptor [Puia sp.]
MQNLTIPLCLLLTASISRLSAQEKAGANTRQASYPGLSLIVVDSASKTPLEGASVYLYDRCRNKTVANFTTDSAGTVRLSPGKDRDTCLLLEIYQAGYKKNYVNPYLIGSAEPVRIYLSRNAKELKAVIVRKAPSPVAFKNNIIEYNLKSIPNFENMTTSDILNYLPFLSVEGNAVKMMGEPILILINNKPHPYYSNPANLNSLSPLAIEKIEVNFLPSARNGLQKVMNITLKKDYFLGWSGNFNINGSRLGLGPGGSVNYWANKFGFTLSTNYAYSNVTGKGASTSSSDPTKTTIDQSWQNGSLGHHGSLFASAFYNLDSFSTVDVQWSGSFNKTSKTIVTDIDYTDSTGMTELQNGNNSSKATSNSSVVGLNYTHKSRKPGKEFYILSQLSSSPSNSNTFLALNSETGGTINPLSLQSNYSHNTANEGTVEALFQNNSGSKFQYTAGGKYIQRWDKSDNELNTLYYAPPSDTIETGNYRYSQYIYNAYADASEKINTKLSVYGGIRWEHVRSVFSDQPTSSYDNLIPNASITFNPNPSNVFSLSYTRNVLRPGFSSLIPFNTLQNTYLQDSGNMNLKPQYNNRYGLQYYGSLHRIQFGAGLDYSYISNFIDEFYTTAADGSVIRTSENSSNKSWTFSFNIDYPVSQKIRFIHFSSGSIVDQSGLGYNNKFLSGYLQEKIFYTLSKKQRLYLSMICYSPNLTLQGKSQSMAYWNTNLSYSYYFRISSNPSQIGLSLSNPWLTRGLPSYERQSGPGIYYYSHRYRANAYGGIQLVINLKGRSYRGSSFDRSKSIQNTDIKQND